MKVDPNAPAYPSNPSKDIYCNLGIPIRLAIAAQIMAGFAARFGYQHPTFMPDSTKHAIAWADALIAAHNEGKP